MWYLLPPCKFRSPVLAAGYHAIGGFRRGERVRLRFSIYRIPVRVVLQLSASLISTRMLDIMSSFRGGEAYDFNAVVGLPWRTHGE